MALLCKNGAKECCGCGENGDLLNNGDGFCGLCGRDISGEDIYDDIVYAPLCIDCLKALHKI